MPKPVFIPWEPTPENPKPPLGSEDLLYVKYRDGLESRARRVKSLRWDHKNLGDDIVGYLVIEHRDWEE